MQRQQRLTSISTLLGLIASLLCSVLAPVNAKVYTNDSNGDGIPEEITIFAMYQNEPNRPPSLTPMHVDNCVTGTMDNQKICYDAKCTEYAVTLQSPTAFLGFNWTAHHIRLFGKGQYAFSAQCLKNAPDANPSGDIDAYLAGCARSFPSDTSACNQMGGDLYCLAVNEGEFGTQMLFNWNNEVNVPLLSKVRLHSDRSGALTTPAVPASRTCFANQQTNFHLTPLDGNFPNNNVGLNQFGIPMIVGNLLGFAAAMGANFSEDPDFNAPTLTIEPGTESENLEQAIAGCQGNTYSTSHALQGVSAVDAEDGDITHKIIVEHELELTAPIGTTFDINYSVSDQADNIASAVRKITISPCGTDITAPTIQLQGDNPMYLELGADYTEPGASCKDTLSDGQITTLPVRIQSPDFNTQQPMQISILYQCEDAAGNTSNMTRLLDINPIDLQLKQRDRTVATVHPDHGVVTIATQIRSTEDYTFNWSNSAASLLSLSTDGISSNPTFSFDPANLVDGIYPITLQVMRNRDGTTTDLQLYVRATTAITNTADDNRNFIADARESSSNLAQPRLPTVIDTQGSEWLHVSSGSLRIGGTALLAGKGAIVTLADIEQFAATTGNSASIDPLFDTSCVGGCFDYEITGLSPGTSATVVLPLASALAPGASYRLFVHQWQSFIEQANLINSVASAPKNNGICPVATDPSFQQGLRAGDGCLRLNISDGGPNDRDGMINGVVAQVAGIASNTPTGPLEAQDAALAAPNTRLGSGGCSLHPVDQRNNLNNLILLIFFCVTLGIGRMVKQI